MNLFASKQTSPSWPGLDHLRENGKAIEGQEIMHCVGLWAREQNFNLEKRQRPLS